MDLTIYDIVYRRYIATGSISDTASLLNISEGSVRKILITTGDYSTKTSREISRLTEQGLSKNEIISKLGISNSCYNVNTPYSKGSYHDFPKTANARRIAACRKRKEKKC